MGRRNYNDDFEEDEWSEMSPERGWDESDDDYDDRMEGLYGEDWNDN